jgi:hypothetical protein
MGHNARRERFGKELPAREEAGMGADLAALTPPFVVGTAFVIGVVMFLRRQMGSRSSRVDDREDGDIGAEDGNADPGDPTHGPSTDQHKV